MGGDHEIRAITRERIPRVAEVFTRALRNDPIVLWPLAADGDVQASIETMFAAIYEGIADSGVIWEAGDAAGFAVWIPAGAHQEMFDSDAAVRDRLSPLTDDGGARYDTLWSWIEDRVLGDAWYLDAIGVDPPQQGRGVGSALIRFGLERAAAQGKRAFLETAVERNVPYYERFGFEVFEEGEPGRGGPHIWCMRTDLS
jgi:ribosomal protein S18 acetylase RimI-like enzyme